MIAPILLTTSLLTSSITPVPTSPAIPSKCSVLRESIRQHYGDSIEKAHNVIQETHMRVYFKIVDPRFEGLYLVLSMWPKGDDHVHIPDQILRQISVGECTVGKDKKLVNAKLDMVLPADIPKKVGEKR